MSSHQDPRNMSPVAISSTSSLNGTPAANGFSSLKQSIVLKNLAKPNVALWVTKDHQIYQKEESFPECPPGQCVIHIRATGICGSEIHFWKHGRIGDCCITHDIILGHESAGQIVQVGEGVTGLTVGDRVSVEPGVSCWECDQCLRGRYNLCPKVAFSGTPPTDGTMRRFVAHPAKFLHKIPDTMSYQVAALVEPLSVAYNAVLRAAPYLGQPALIAGAGPIGLAMALCARGAGCHPICLTDLNEERLAQARKMGFEHTLKMELGWDRHEAARRIREIMPVVPSIAFECTGAESSINSAIYALEDGGTLLQVGCGKPDIKVPLMSMGFREVNIVTSFRYRMSWPTIIRLVTDSFFGDVSAMITHSFPLERTIEAFETSADPQSHSIKVQIIDEE